MKILGLDTSCDDTSIAIIQTKGEKFDQLLSNIVSSQTEIHKKWGGVFPAMAKREHQNNLVPVLIEALKNADLLKEKSKKESIDLSILSELSTREPELKKDLENFLANYQKPDIDFIALTTGPGLEPCLWTGINFAKALSFVWQIQIIPVHHVEAHLLSVFLENKDIPLPALGLIVSGGHTQIIFTEKIGQYKIIGETLDDAAGECFDKVARILGLGYPGGPLIEKLASEENTYTEKLVFPRPMIKSKNFDFSFSGLKTAVLYDKQKKCPKGICSPEYVKAAALEAQNSILETLIFKTIQAAKLHKVKSLIIGGGVSASQTLRDKFKASLEKELPDIKLFIPAKNLSTDNGAMIAIAGLLHKRDLLNFDSEIKADSNFKI